MIENLYELKEKLDKTGSKEIDEYVDLSFEDDIPEWLQDLSFKNVLIVPSLCNLNNLPRNMSEAHLHIGGVDNYTLPETRENLEGLPHQIKYLHIQCGLTSTKGFFGVNIYQTLSFSVKRIKVFEELPHLLPACEEFDNVDFADTQRVYLFGNDYPSIVAKHFWETRDYLTKDWHLLEEQIEEECLKDYQDQILDSI